VGILHIRPRNIRSKIVAMFLVAIAPMAAVQVAYDLHAIRAGGSNAVHHVSHAGMAAAAVLVGLLVVVVTGTRLAAPVRRLALAAKALSVGDYRKRVNIKTGDELEFLGESFNALGRCMATREEALNDQATFIAGTAEAARMASESLDIPSCGKAIARVICTHMGAKDATVFRKDYTKGELRPVGRFGRRHRAAWRSLAAHVSDSGGYLVISEKKHSDAADQASVLVGIPLRAGGTNLGAIVARYPGPASASDFRHGSHMAETLGVFGHHASAALRNADIHSKAERYSEVLEDWIEHLSSVMQVTNAISPALSLDETLKALVRTTARVMNATDCVIFLPDRNGRLIRRCSCRNDEYPHHVEGVMPGEYITGRAFASGQHLACPDCAVSKYADVRELSRTTGVRAVLSTPLTVDERAIGAITVVHYTPKEFTQREIQILTSIGLHAAVVVRNAALFTRESSIAQSLQKCLVSEAPSELRGLIFASRYLPGLDEASVGGDFFDVVALPEGKVGVVIADVSGKGLQAAMHLAACKHMLKSFIYSHPNNPGLVLERLNDALNYYYDLSFFVTVFYAVIDPIARTVDYANAGHPPGLLIAEDGKVMAYLASTGTPAGCGEPCAHGSRRVQAGPDDLLLLYTDGVIDATRGGSPIGVEGLRDLVFERSADAEPLELVDYILSRINDDPGSCQKDDVAILAVSLAGAADYGTTGGGKRGTRRVPTDVAA